MGSRTLSIPDHPDVLELLPHREPMVFLEQIIVVNRSTRTIRARKRFKPGECYFKGHFPALPIVPGVVIVEGMAQAGLLIFQLVVRRLRDDEVPVLTRAQTRFFRPVFPGQSAVFEARIEKATRNAAIFRAQAKISGIPVAEAEMTFGVKCAKALRKLW